MLQYKDLTQNQIDTLLYFAYGYSLKKIAKKQKISLSTVQQRIKSCKKKHPEAFDNASCLRNSYKRAKENIHNVEHIDKPDIWWDFKKSGSGDAIKYSDLSYDL